MMQLCMYCLWAETAKSCFPQMITTVSEAKDKTIEIQESTVLARKDSQIADVALKCHTLQWKNFCMMHLHVHDYAA